MNPDQTNNPIPLSVNGNRVSGISRREAMQWVLAAVAAASAPIPGASNASAQEVGRTTAPQELAAKQPDPLVKGGYGSDPLLTKTYKPGDVWPLTFTDAQKRAAIALADVILPKDDLGPAASEVGVPEMIDEWISAPYPQQLGDRPVIVEGLAWLDAESMTRFKTAFADLPVDQQHQICDDICFTGTAKPAFAKAAQFFSRFRWLCAAAYYATPAGWKAIGYVGNVPLEKFDGPPAEVLEKLGVTQTVI